MARRFGAQRQAHKRKHSAGKMRAPSEAPSQVGSWRADLAREVAISQECESRREAPSEADHHPNPLPGTHR